jgi:penicillin-binding protein 1A
MAMPAYAYFFQELYKDKTLNMDPNAKFIVPESIRNEAIYDYQALTGGEAPPPAEGENVGAGSSSDFIDVPISDGTEKVNTESKKVEDENKKEEKKKDSEVKPDKKPEATDTTKKKKKKFLEGLFRKKDNQ